jgi:hypothetical protein
MEPINCWKWNIGPRPPLAFRWGRFLDWQTKHCWHHSAISLLIPGQYTLLWRRALVRLTPKWPDTNKYLLVVSDYFTRWVEAYPLPNSEAITVAQVFIEEFISRYGLPRQIHTDRGSQFTSLLFKNICEIFRIDKDINSSIKTCATVIASELGRG